MSREHGRKIEVAKFRMMWWTCGRTLLYKITNVEIKNTFRVVSIIKF